MATIINGKEVSANVKEQVAEEVKQLKEKGIYPGQVGQEDLLAGLYGCKKNYWIWYTN